MHSLNFTIFFIANSLPVKYIRTSRKKIVQFFLNERFTLPLTANSPNRLNCQNGFSMQGIQVRHFLLNEHVQIFSHGSMLTNKYRKTGVRECTIWRS